MLISGGSKTCNGKEGMVTMDASYFDIVIDRTEKSETYSSKWLAVAERFPGYDPQGVLPMWVADMDFRCPPEVIDAVKKRAEHGIYGYTDSSLVRKFIEAGIAWFQRRYGWEADPDWGFFTPGVVPVINAAVQEFSNPGGGIIIQSPVYYPFADGPRNNGRVLKHNRLIEKDGCYEVDFANLEELASDPDTKLFILCHPHNPVGRVWTREELKKMCDICVKHDVIILSDEIHADLILNGQKHVPAAALGEEIANHVIATYAPSKTFNLAGLGASVIIAPNAELRERMKKRVLANRLPASNVFGPLAGEVAYRTGDSYVDALVEYVGANMDYVVDFCKQNLPKIIARKSEGTYMIWIDLRGLGLCAEAANAFVIEKAKIAGDFGTWFGPGGEGFVRLNLACPRKIVEQAMGQLKAAYDKLAK